MLTPFGKAARRYRDEINASSKDMAAYLGIPTSYLSAMEHGQKKVPQKVIDGAYAYFGERGPELSEWVALAAASPTHIKLDMTSADELEREVYEAVGRKFKSMPHNVKKEIRDLLRGDDERSVPRDRVSRSENQD